MKNKEIDLCFKFVCYYHAKTEEYDRTLTDLRDRYDPTSAYVTGIQARYSKSYAQGILRKIVKAGFSSKVFGGMLRKYTRNQSAQWWVDTYYHLLENGEMEDVEQAIWKAEMVEAPKRIELVKNPFL